MNVTENQIPTGHPNRPGGTLVPVGVMWHRTGRDVGAMWLGDYFSREPRQAIVDNNAYGSSHYGVDDEGVVRYIPEDEIANGCVANARNYYDLHVECCQYFDVPPRVRPKTYGHMVDLAADICRRYGFAPRDPIPGDEGRTRFRRHQDEDPVDRPNDPGEYLRWDDFLDDVEYTLLTGEPWQMRKVGATVEQALLELTTKIGSLARDIIVWIARLQRNLDVERGTPFDPNVPPIDSRIQK